MEMSRDEAELQFSKWRSERDPVRLMVRTPLDEFTGDGEAAGILRVHFDTRWRTHEVWRLVLSISDATFKFLDPREAPIPVVRESVMGKYECAVEITLPIGAHFVLMEHKLHP